MAVEVRVARVGLVQVSTNGDVFTKNEKRTMKEHLQTETQHRVLDSTAAVHAPAPNSAGYPTIEQYVEAEAGDDFSIAYMDQNMIVTNRIT